MNKPVLDACCGSRMFWFDRKNPFVEFCDRRQLDTTLCDGRKLVVAPDTVADFTNLPFPNETFYLTVFDPPHLEKVGGTSWLAQKYGRLEENWRDMLAKGFAECWRTLRPGGTLIFKWNETDVSLSEVLKLFSRSPMFGHTTGRQSKTKWVCFWKDLYDSEDSPL